MRLLYRCTSGNELKVGDMQLAEKYQVAGSSVAATNRPLQAVSSLLSAICYLLSANRRFV